MFQKHNWHKFCTLDWKGRLLAKATRTDLDVSKIFLFLGGCHFNPHLDEVPDYVQVYMELYDAVLYLCMEMRQKVYSSTYLYIPS